MLPLFAPQAYFPCVRKVGKGAFMGLRHSFLTAYVSPEGA